MTPPAVIEFETPAGLVAAARRDGATVHRVGYLPQPWTWTPWEYATDGRFTGRWDDPDGVWRTLYCGATPLACLLEVLAFARPSPQVLAELEDIVVDDEDAELYPSTPPGQLPPAWCHPRVLADGTITGTYVLPGHPVSLAALRTLFRRTAITYGLDDLDGAAIRDGRPRALTQTISRWINTLTSTPGTSPVAGIEFDSRHGDGLTLWAVYEQAGDPTISPHIVDLGRTTLTPDNADLTHAMELLNIVWSN